MPASLKLRLTKPGGKGGMIAHGGVIVRSEGVERTSKVKRGQREREVVFCPSEPKLTLPFPSTVFLPIVKKLSRAIAGNRIRY